VPHITDEELASLPDEPEEAFIELERLVRERYQDVCNQTGDEGQPVWAHRSYMNIVLKAAKHYGIDELTEWKRPGLGDESWELYEEFMADVEFCVTGLRLRKAEGLKQNSVVIDKAGKIKLRHLLSQIRDTVENLEVSVAKKEALYKRISALQAEIDRDRTRYQAVAALMIEACDDAGEAAKRLEPVVRLIERVGAAIGVAKRAEDARPKLPPRRERKQITPPKFIVSKKRASGYSGGFDKSLNDEIPF